MQTQQNMKKNKRTQGTFFIDAGDTISELLLRVETKEEGNTELFDICDFIADETGNVKANAEFICEAVNNYDKLKEDNALLLDALKTIEARANGDWDNPLLIKHGFLSSEFDNDVLSIVKEAIQKVGSK